ncbi:lipid IV(A) 3-deoxy-D-manno-octulosonic acid transferase [Aliikangiella sp. G2MR2-5]|uniref:lipid IV(A) 3-deoxy-D-manno-octulosonic acid transferase n=1 Tax=Aliikangiella sp. G2MR2-5 TaxID=2788943 RepID=UPI002113000C|nr:lipid IV(A) 3-deoxy-D-manno-octulosonic acid transferase [Aliikangiella sp. G2MR2-5]
MNYFTYNLLMYILSPMIWCYLGLRALRSSDYREGGWERLGIHKKVYPQAPLLIHCASVGETKAAIPLIKSLLKEKVPLVVSTTTPTGKAVVQAELGTSVEHCYLPIDWYGSCRRFVSKLKPKGVIIMETELWPNLLGILEKRGIPVMLANARLSEKSKNKYLKRAAFSKVIIQKVSLIAAQYESDRANFKAIGAKTDALEVVGNIKFDLSVSEQLKAQQKHLLSQIQAGIDERPVWVAASIHPGEFDAVLSAHRALLDKEPEALLVGIPRHPERFEEFAQKVRQSGLNYCMRSKGEQVDNNTQVIVGDTMGEVMLFCGAADLVFVGGSLVAKGGHNPLEAIACGKPVLVGPSIESFQDICDALYHKKCLKYCSDLASLTLNIQNLMSDKDARAKMSVLAQQFMRENSGSAAKQIKLVKTLLAL